MGIEVNKLHPLFAAELIGIDAAQPDAATVELVEDLMREYAVLCIRGQGHIDDEQHLAFARQGDAAGGAVEQGAAHHLLQPLHAQADGGLRQAERFAGGGEAARLGNQDEAAEKVEVEVGKAHDAMSWGRHAFRIKA